VALEATQDDHLVAQLVQRLSEAATDAGTAACDEIVLRANFMRCRLPNDQV